MWLGWESPTIAAEESLLSGAIEFHVHTAPDVVPRLWDDQQLVDAAEAAGLRAVVLKNHVLPTGDRAQLAQQRVQRLQVFGGVVLNEAVGGLNPEAVRVMSRISGGRGKVVWLPTLDAAYHRQRFGQGNRGISLLQGDRLSRELELILYSVRDRQLVLATGHVSPAEVLAVVRRARELGIDKLLITHAMAEVPGLSLAQMQTLADLGAYLELDYVNALMGEAAVDPAHRAWRKVSLGEMAEAIRAIGSEHIILSTDLGRPEDPNPIAGYKAFIQELRNQGISEADLKRMTQENPARLLDLPSR
ncbi:DUF6282 family protein [Geitlerinema sp. P-1104]|uniref:DUF6282 family protein n=1 Tax=Geitlerinema sp. P-1104 TaxID=2546230 RepID=UPI00336BB39A